MGVLACNRTGCDNKSKMVKLTEYLRNMYPVNNKSKANRKLVCGVGTNDSDYVTNVLINGVRSLCPAYLAWVSMLNRCYSEKFNRAGSTYKDATVCAEWLIFSNFRKWFIENHVDDYQLDKDLLSIGNKLYSPHTCIYVPQWLNSFVISAAANRGKYKIGVSWHKHYKKFSARCRYFKRKDYTDEFIGHFNTEHEAYTAWLTRKLEIASELKPEMNEIDVRIYPNIVNIVKNMN